MKNQAKFIISAFRLW